MEKKKPLRLYNILFPLWLLIWWPSPLWLALIPLNYLIDRLVLHWSLPADTDKRSFCRRHTWKVCLAGFFSDFAGSAVLYAACTLPDKVRDPAMRKFVNDIAYQPFGSFAAFGTTLLAVVLAGALIWLLDRLILKKAGLTPEQAKKAALRLALITAPYLFLFPSGLLYK